MTNLKAKSSMQIGSLKNGYIHIKADELVKVVKVTEKSVYVEKNGLVKILNKSLFYEA